MRLILLLGLMVSALLVWASVATPGVVATSLGGSGSDAAVRDDPQRPAALTATPRSRRATPTPTLTKRSANATATARAKNVTATARAKKAPRTPTLTATRTPRPTRTPTPTPVVQGWDTYDNGIMRFTIKVVPEWTVDESRELGVVFNSPDKRGMLTIVSFAGADYSLDDSADFRIGVAQNDASGYLATFEMISEERVVLPQRREAVRLVYRWKDFPASAEFCDTQYVDYIVLAGGWEYLLRGAMCVEYLDAFLADLEAMQQSFIASR